MKDSQFSQREKEVIDLLIQGKSNKQIALTLHIAQSTVEYHLKNVYQKLDVHSRTEAVLRLGKSIGADSPGELRESIVETDRRDVDNDDKSLMLRRFPMNQKGLVIVGLLVLIFSLVAVSILRRRPAPASTPVPPTFTPFSTNTLIPPTVTPTSTEEATITPSPTLWPIVSPEVIKWDETISLPIASSAPFNDARGQQIIFHNGYIYIFGGSSANDSQLGNVYFSAIGPDGTLAEWVQTTSLPGKYYDHVVVKTGEYVYLLTGAAGAEDVYYAPFNVDGSIGTWKKTASLSPGRQQFAAVSHGNFIYTTGGNSGGNQAFVQYTSAKSDGSLNNWTSTTPLPDRIQAHTMIAYNGYLYVFGGKNASDVWVTAIYFSAINEDGTLAGWETTTSLPRRMSSYSTFESNGYVYLIGGSSSTSYHARILENHALDAWKAVTSLPNTNILGLRTGAYNGFAYAMGGYKNGFQSMVYYGFIGSQQPSESPTLTLETSTPSSTSTWDRYEPGTIGQIVSDTHGELASLSEEGYYYNVGPDHATKVVATYTGQFRITSELRRFLIGNWFESVTTQFSPAQAVNLFATEGLFVEDTIEYWLPIQGPLIPLMNNELTEGKPVTLFIIWIGATFFDNELDRVFLVNEFLAKP